MTEKGAMNWTVTVNMEIARDENQFRDDAVRLTARHQLYGRADAVVAMLESLEWINRGSGELLLIRDDA